MAIFIFFLAPQFKTLQSHFMLYFLICKFLGPNFMNSFFMLNIGTLLNFIIFCNYKNEIIKLCETKY